mmetsp:Transcript_21006/g.43248  ORF Transcript_21006/g.43248 Transcript_21006/m.43248 type:complete len:201 (-) Transcript_21006:127-729(-)
MPSGASLGNFSIGVCPAGVWSIGIVLKGFPKGKIAGITFHVFSHRGRILLGFHLVHVQLNELFSVALLVARGKPPRAVLRLVGQVFFGQLQNHFHHFRYVFRRPRVPGGELDIQSLQIVKKVLFEFYCELVDLANFQILFVGTVDNLVVHVRQIANVVHLVAEIQQDPLDQIVRQEGTKVSYVCIVVNGGPAGVHGHLVF